MTPPDHLTFCDRRAKSTLSSKFPSYIRYASGNFSGKQRISFLTNFPLHVIEGKLVDIKEIFCLPLNFPLAYRMYEGNLEDKVLFGPSVTECEVVGRGYSPISIFSLQLTHTFEVKTD